MDFLVANWVPLLITLIVGLILGWLIFGLPQGRRRSSAEQESSQRQSQLSATSKELSDAKSQIESLRQQLAREGEALSEERNRASQLQDQVTSLQAEVEQLGGKLQTEEEQLAEANAKLAGPVRLFEKVSGVPPKNVSIDLLTPAKAPAIIAGIMGGIKLTLMSDVQDMAKVRGIGQTSEQRLYDAGIGTYWELANLTDESLDEILKPSPAQRAQLDFNNLRADALKNAQDTESVGAIWNARGIDDFEAIPGIRGVYEQRLYDHGITTYEQLASKSADEMNEIISAPPTMMPNYAAWIEKARELAEEKKSKA